MKARETKSMKEKILQAIVAALACASAPAQVNSGSNVGFF